MTIDSDFEKQIDEVITHYPCRSAARRCRCCICSRKSSATFRDEAIAWIAAKLELQPINVLELVTFYPMFRPRAGGQKHIRVCRTLSCALAGSYQLRDNRRACGIELHAANRNGPSDQEHSHRPKSCAHRCAQSRPRQSVSVSPDGKFPIEFVECLASCGTAPVAMVNDDFHEDVQARPRI